MTVSTFCSGTARIWRFIGYIIYVIRIAIPIIIILLGTIDLGKAVIAGEDKKVKEAQKSFVMRIIYGVAVFFVFPIVEIIFSLLGVDTSNGNAKVCWDCATKPNNKVCARYIDEIYEADSNTTETTTYRTIKSKINREEA